MEPSHRAFTISPARRTAHCSDLAGTLSKALAPERLINLKTRVHDADKNSCFDA